MILEGTKGYKYLGITEDQTSKPMRESFDRLKTELLEKVVRPCTTKLNAKNLFKAINEHSISLVNYYVSFLRLELSDFDDLDHAARQVLLKHQVHIQSNNTERLYISRTELEAK